jgi:hypothetical protein
MTVTVTVVDRVGESDRDRVTGCDHQTLSARCVELVFVTAVRWQWRCEGVESHLVFGRHQVLVDYQQLAQALLQKPVVYVERRDLSRSFEQLQRQRSVS